MAQKVIEFKVQPAPVTTTGTTIFTAASFDLSSLPGGIGNITDCTVGIRSKVLRFEVGGGTYSNMWERVAVFRRDAAANPVLVGSQANGNAETNGNVGQSGSTDVLLYDATGTVIRQRITPQSGTHWWWVTLYVNIVQGA